MNRRALTITLLMLVSACGGDGRSPYGGTEDPTAIKIGKPYQAGGKYYVPQYDPHYAEEGYASWYGPGFDGRQTASGEKFDENELTAAHRTLPMPSLVRVTHLESGRSIIARVNDRGPFAKERIIDLSKGAAQALGIRHLGVAKVRVEYLPEETETYIADLGLSKPAEWYQPESTGTRSNSEIVYAEEETASSAPLTPSSGEAPPLTAIEEGELPPLLGEGSSGTPAMLLSLENVTPPKPEPAYRAAPFEVIESLNPISSAQAAEPISQGYFIQVASFGAKASAYDLAEKLATLATANVVEVTVGQSIFYRVKLGPLHSDAAANALLTRVQTEGYKDARLVR